MRCYNYLWIFIFQIPINWTERSVEMKLGLVTAILEHCDFTQMIDTVSSLGFACIEAACWPAGKAERRYAGVSHIDVGRVLVDKAYADYVLEYAKAHDIEISALAYYPNTMDGDLVKRQENISHLKKVIQASSVLGINLVTTFIGRDQNKTVEENLALVAELWPPILAFAEELDVDIAIENCPMLFGADQWPGGQNLMTTPAIWRRVFEILPNSNLGINYDPSHFVWQMMDYIAPLYEFRDKIFHVHFKDVKLYRNRLNEVGVMAYPLEYMAPKLPGLGDVDWGNFVSALTDIGYDGYCCLEVEDRAFEGSGEKILKSLLLSKQYLKQYVV